MPLVGDLIIGLREAATDLPVGKLLLPGTEMVASQGGNVAGSTLPAANYYVQLTYNNPWGETTPKSPGGSILIDGTHTVIVVSGIAPPGVTGITVYFGTVANSPNQSVLLPVSASGAFTANISTPGTVAALPLRNTAYLPDTDGRAISRAAVFRWLNEGMRVSASICGGGLPNLTGVPSITGQPLYTMTGNWKRILNAWYDGYPMYLGSKGDVSRKAKVTGYGGSITVDIIAERTVVEIYPQPPRTAGASTLTAPMTATATTCSVAASNFVLSFGLCMIGTEICAFTSNSTGTVSGLIRGVGGTVPSAWPSGTAITELNIMVDGLLVPTDYAVGDSAKTLYLPPGWEHIMGKYLLARFREAEQNSREYSRLMQEFQGALSSYLATNKPVAGPTQIRAGGKRGTEVAVGLGSPFGGIIVP